MAKRRIVIEPQSLAAMAERGLSQAAMAACLTAVGVKVSENTVAVRLCEMGLRKKPLPPSYTASKYLPAAPPRPRTYRRCCRCGGLRWIPRGSITCGPCFALNTEEDGMGVYPSLGASGRTPRRGGG